MLCSSKENHCDEPYYLIKPISINTNCIELEKNPERDIARNIKEDLKDEINILYILNGEYNIIDKNRQFVIQIKVGFKIIDIIG